MEGSLELIRQIGEGGHSVVFLARRHGSHGFQRLVAVKVIRRDSNLPSIVGDRFLHEARLLGMLRHRAIIAADNVVELPVGTAIVMEFVPGHDLSEVALLQRRRPGSVPLGWLAHVGLEVASALKAAWSWPSPLTGAPLRVLHCDLKPSNVRLTPDGSVKLLDFGVSTSTIDTTATGPLMGTVAYAAPERLFGGASLPEGDLFSLGLSLLAVARGRPMGGRPIAPEASAEWIKETIDGLRPDFVPMAPLLRDLTALEPEDRPSHSEVRERLFALVRRYAKRPPSDVSEDLLSLAPQCSGGLTLEDTGSEVRMARPKKVPTTADITLSETMMESIAVPAPDDTGRPALTGEVLLPEGLAALEVRMGQPALRHIGNGLDETSILLLESTPLKSGEDEDDRLADLVAAWFTGSSQRRVVSLVEETRIVPPARYLAALAVFRGWFPLDSALEVLRSDPAISMMPGGPVEVLGRMLDVGWLEARRDGVVAALRVVVEQQETAELAWMRLDKNTHRQLIRTSTAALLSPYAAPNTLLDVACGAGPGAELARDIADTLLMHIGGAPRPRQSWVAAVLRVRAGGDRTAARDLLSGLEENRSLTAAEHRSLAVWGELVDHADPWVPVGNRIGRLRALVREDPADGLLLGVLLAKSARLGGDADLVSESLEAHEPTPNSSVAALRALEQAELAVRRGKVSVARAACASALSIAEYGFLDRVAVQALCLDSEVLRSDGKLDAAVVMAGRAVLLADGLGCPRMVSVALANRAIGALLQGDMSGAISDLEEASEHLVDGDTGLQTWVRAWLGGAWLRNGMLDKARTCLRRLDPETDGLPPELSVLVHSWSARLAMLQREPLQATQSLRTARMAQRVAGGLTLPSVRRVYVQAGLAVSRTKAHRREGVGDEAR